MTAAARRPAATGGVLVIGIGNPDRGDDGVGPLVVRRLVGRVPPGVAIIERSGNALALIDDWAGRDAVVLVDAAAGTTPGCVHRIDLLADALPTDLSLASTHAFGVAEAVRLARTLGLLPERVIAYAIEGADFGPGAPVSPQVAASLAAAAARVAAELCHLQHELAQATEPACTGADPRPGARQQPHPRR